MTARPVFEHSAKRMKKSEYIFSALLVPFDWLMVVLAGLAAYKIRFGAVAGLRPVVYELTLSEFRTIVMSAAVLFVVVFAINGLYAMRANRGRIDELGKIFTACATATLIIITLIFVQRELFSSRFILLTGWFLAFVFVSVGRLLVRAIQSWQLTRGVGQRRAIIIGDDVTANSIAAFLKQHPRHGYMVVGQYPQFTEQTEAALKELVTSQPIDSLIVAGTDRSKDIMVRVTDFCSVHHIVMKFAADVLNAPMGHIAVEAIAGVPLLEVRRTKLEGWGWILKRLVDIILSTLGLIILSPVFLLLTILIRLDSPGRAVLGLTRIGYRGREFTVYKFRSMVDGAHSMKPQLEAMNERPDGPLFKMTNDPRVTRLGRTLRRTSLDELPQLWNVLIGTMSLVGPRPHEPEEVARYKANHHKLLTIRPGLTGLAQVSGRSNLSFEDEVRLDVFYVENWSLKLDWQILFRTIGVVFRQESAV